MEAVWQQGQKICTTSNWRSVSCGDASGNKGATQIIYLCVVHEDCWKPNFTLKSHPPFPKEIITQPINCMFAMNVEQLAERNVADVGKSSIWFEEYNKNSHNI